MAEISKQKYQEYADKIVSLLRDDQFYHSYKDRIEKGRNNFETVRRRHKQIIDMTWVNAIEECIVSLDTIVRNPRKFIVQEEDIVDISLARSISTESVKHLAQHTNLIAQVDKQGNVTPNKILNTSKEESFEIYENRFIYTLLKKVKGFISIRFDKIKAACAMKDTFQLSVNSNFAALSNRRLTVKLDCMAQMSFNDLIQTNNDDLTDIERVAKLDRIISDFLASPFAKQMVSSAPVRPPITRTNVILKNPDFKKALVLWQFVETYRDDGFKLIDEVSSMPVKSNSTIEALTDLVTLNSFIFETLTEDASLIDEAEVKEEELTILQREEPTIEIPEPEAEEETEVEEEPEVPEEPEAEEEQPQEEEQPEEPEIEEPEIEEEVEPEVEEELPEEEEIVEPEEEVETPEEEPEEEIIDEKEFIGDDNLYPFEVKKLYKRPEDDRVSPEEIQLINTALDRVLQGYKDSRTQDQIEEAIKNRARRKELEIRAADTLRLEREKEAERLRTLRDLTHLRTIKDELDKQYAILKELQALQEDVHVEIAREKSATRLYNLQHEADDLQQKILAVKATINSLNDERIKLNALKAQEEREDYTKLLNVEEETPVESAEDSVEEVEETPVEEVEVEEPATEDATPEEKLETVELKFDDEGNVIDDTAVVEEVAETTEPVEEADVEEDATAEEILTAVLPEDAVIPEEFKDKEYDKALDEDATDDEIMARVLGGGQATTVDPSMAQKLAHYDFSEDEEEDDTFLLARKMITQRLMDNRANNEDSEEARQILSAIKETKSDYAD